MKPFSFKKNFLKSLKEKLKMDFKNVGWYL